MNDPLFIVVDLFCGAGGTTTGFEDAKLPDELYQYYVGPEFLRNGFTKIAQVIACVNHDPKAIKSHWYNHPGVKHFEEDIRTLDLAELVKLVEYYRRKYPRAILILWASLECTNFSKAKGGLPRDADSRTLADHLHRYIVALSPDYVQIENVVEFMSWGPLDEKGKPVSRKNGEDWLRWRQEICAHGYIDQWKELNSANYGAYTSRNRLFGVFSKEGLPIAWPEPTHTKVKVGKTDTDLFYNSLKPWKAVKEVLDFSDEGQSIFNRKKPLTDKTLERIYAGLLKFVAGGNDSFIQKHFSGKPHGKVIPVDGPAGVITTSANQSLVKAVFIAQRNTGNPESKLVDTEGPARTLTSTSGNQDLVQTYFLSHYYGTSGQYSSIEIPALTIPTKARTALVDIKFLAIYNGKSAHRSVNEPSPVIACNDRLCLVQPFIMPTNYDNKPVSVDRPAPTITANRKHHYIVNPSHGGHCTSADAPCPVIIARQDKAPLYMVQAEAGPVAVCVYESDSEIMVKIKQFMAVYGIVDIKMRMLRVMELLKIQGFPEGYRLAGNQADQKKFIGNSVVPHVVKAWAEAMAMRIIENQSQKVA